MPTEAVNKEEDLAETLSIVFAVVVCQLAAVVDESTLKLSPEVNVP